jgi:hypothetical protein
MTALAIGAGVAFVAVMTVLYGAICVSGDCSRREESAQLVSIAGKDQQEGK